jgi:hypothetical protein
MLLTIFMIESALPISYIITQIPNVLRVAIVIIDHAAAGHIINDEIPLVFCHPVLMEIGPFPMSFMTGPVPTVQCATGIIVRHPESLSKAFEKLTFVNPDA